VLFRNKTRTSPELIFFNTGKRKSKISENMTDSLNREYLYGELGSRKEKI